MLRRIDIDNDKECDPPKNREKYKLKNIGPPKQQNSVLRNFQARREQDGKSQCVDERSSREEHCAACCLRQCKKELLSERVKSSCVKCKACRGPSDHER